MKPILTTSKTLLKYLRHIIKKEGLANVTLTWHIECRSRRKRQVTNLKSLCKWMTVMEGKGTNVV